MIERPKILTMSEMIAAVWTLAELVDREEPVNQRDRFEAICKAQLAATITYYETEIERLEDALASARTETAREIFGQMVLENCDPSVGPWFDPYYSLPAEALDALKVKYGVEGK